MAGFKSASTYLCMTWSGAELENRPFFGCNPVYTTWGSVSYPLSPPGCLLLPSPHPQGQLPRELWWYCHFSPHCSAGQKLIFKWESPQSQMNVGCREGPSFSWAINCSAYGNTGNQSQPQLPALLTIRPSSVYVHVCMHMLKVRQMFLSNEPPFNYSTGFNHMIIKPRAVTGLAVHSSSEVR